MPDKTVEQGQPGAAVQDQPTGAPEPSPAPIQEVEPPDTPQSVPYIRFKEVNDEKKAETEARRAAERRAADAEQRLTQTQQAQQPQQVTIEQILSSYERGQITEGQKDQWVMYLAKEAAKQEFSQSIGVAAQLMKAQGVVEQYAKAIPAVNDTSTREFVALKATYQELLDEGYPATVASQAKAMRMTFGPLKTTTDSAREHTRQRADTFLEGAGSGEGRSYEHDPLKDASVRQQEYWKQRGYTKTQMMQDMKLRDVRNVDDFRGLTAKPK